MKNLVLLAIIVAAAGLTLGACGKKHHGGGKAVVAPYTYSK